MGTDIKCFALRLQEHRVTVCSSQRTLPHAGVQAS
jgi:hypothetical protein